MSQVRELHRKAMSLLDEANVARMHGDEEQARELLRRAFETEKQAAEQLADSYEHEPTRSILFRSAALLALDCGDYDGAERLAEAGLAGHPPDALAIQLHDIQAQIQVGISPKPVQSSA